MDTGANYYWRFLDGDVEGLTLIVKEYKDGLILYINSYVNNIYLAEDLMQETLFKLVMKKPRFKGKSSFKTWLYAIARNVTIDYLRHDSKVSLSQVEDMESYIKDEENLERLYINNESKIILHKAIATLKADYRQVLWLVYFENFSNDQAALVMNKSKRQVENLLFRAKQSLKSVLNTEGLSYEEL